MSAFQKRIRSGAGALTDHVCKEMNPLNLERCRCIPKGVPGADWRVLQHIVAQDPSREKFQVGATELSNIHISSWPCDQSWSICSPPHWYRLLLGGRMAGLPVLFLRMQRVDSFGKL